MSNTFRLGKDEIHVNDGCVAISEKFQIISW